VIHDTLATLAPVDGRWLPRLREHWRWLDADELAPLGITAIGDWLFLDPEGAGHRLDTIEAVVDRVAADVSSAARSTARTSTSPASTCARRGPRGRAAGVDVDEHGTISGWV
jgi:hypothetical protein